MGEATGGSEAISNICLCFVCVRRGQTGRFVFVCDGQTELDVSVVCGQNWGKCAFRADML